MSQEVVEHMESSAEAEKAIGMHLGSDLDLLLDIIPESMLRFLMTHVDMLGDIFAAKARAMVDNPDLSDPNLNDDDRKLILEAIKLWASANPVILSSSYAAGYIRGMYEYAAWNGLTTAITGGLWGDNDDESVDMDDIEDDKGATRDFDSKGHKRDRMEVTE